MPLFVPRDRKSLFRQFLAGMYDAVVITDPNGHILEVNPRAVEYFGYSQEEVQDRPVSIYIPGLSQDVVRRIRRGLDEDRHMMIDANGVAKGGGKFACEVTVSAIDLLDPGDLVFTVRNVERRRRIRDMLRAKESAFAISQSALFTCARDGTVSETNEAFDSMFGAQDARPSSFAAIMPDDPLPANFAKALEGETTVVRIAADAGEGGRTVLEVVLAPDRDGRKIRGVVGSVSRV